MGVCGDADGKANMMKAGIILADKILTVSPTYARELRLPEYGMGLEDDIDARGADMAGILNGVDESVFDPGTDAGIAENYTADDPSGKMACKTALLSECGLSGTAAGTHPLICMIGRMTAQKGLDIVCLSAEAILGGSDAMLVILGSGEVTYEDYFRGLALKYPKRVFVRIGYDEVLAHRLYAGADFLLMPSLFEPCGLAQMIAQRYGTLPIVRRTGGLADSVSPFRRSMTGGNVQGAGMFDANSPAAVGNVTPVASGAPQTSGTPQIAVAPQMPTAVGTVAHATSAAPQTPPPDCFAFSEFTGNELTKAVMLALEVYRNKSLLEKMRENAMRRDNGFTHAAMPYLELYQKLIVG
jgi:ADP-glucose type glycogen/starch synthase